MCVIPPPFFAFALLSLLLENWNKLWGEGRGHKQGLHPEQQEARCHRRTLAVFLIS